MRPIALPLALSAALLFPGTAVRAQPSPADLDREMRRLMTREGTEGAALAVVEDGRVTHVAAYGRRTVERDLPLTPSTVMYGASLTKTAFAYLVLQLVDEGRLDLDRPLAELFPRPLSGYPGYAALGEDPRWRRITPRIVLTQSTGLPNFGALEPDRQAHLHFTPGERYAYSGEGFRLLQLALEQGLGLDVGAEMDRRVFRPLGMTRTGMTWREDFAENLADGYALDGGMRPHDERSGVSAAGSMDTTIEDQAKLWAGIVRGEGLSPASRAEMTRAQEAIASAHQFPTLSEATDPRNAEVGLSAGLGVVTFRGPAGPGWFKGGHDDFTGNMVVCLERGRRCVVLLANDVRAERFFPEIVRFVLGETGLPWSWEYDWIAGR